MHVYIYMYTYVYVFVCVRVASLWAGFIYVCVHILLYVYVCLYNCIYAYINEHCHQVPLQSPVLKPRNVQHMM